MRLTSLTLENYGVFQSRRIAFDPAPGRINLLIAPNGAGKSILRNAFCDLLFGIHGQTAMGFRYGYNRMRLMAEAIGPTGETRVFGRRKGQGNTLIGADGATLDPAALAPLLGAADRTLVERLFALDTERLRQGGNELLASNGSVADALLSAAGGLRQARQLQQSLLGARDALAPLRRSQGRPFYQALDNLQESRRRLAEATLKPETRERQQAERAELEGRQEQANQRAAAASQRIARLERIRRVVGVLAEHDAAAAWLAAHPDAPALPADTGEKLDRARDELSRAGQMLERERTNRQAAAEQAASIRFDAALLEHGAAIEQCVDRAGAARQALADIPKREAELALTNERIAGILRQLGRDLPTEQAGEAIPPHAAVVQARRLANDHARLRVTLDQLPAELAQAEADAAATEAALAALPAGSDTSALARLLREIRAAGDPDRRAAELAQTVADRRAKLAQASARLSGWTHGVAALVALPAMPAETYDRMSAACLAADAACAAADKDCAEVRQAIAAAGQRLREIAGGQPMPDEGAIEAARRHRDLGWRLIYRRAFTADPPDAAAERDWSGALPLPLAFERAMAAADDLADRRNREGERLAQAAEVARGLDALRQRLLAAVAAADAASGPRDEARAAWAAACAALGLPPATTVGEVRALLAGRERVIDADHELAAAAREQAGLAQQHAAWTQRLESALAHPPGSAGLPALLALADDRIDAGRRTEQTRERLRERLAAERRVQDGKRAALRAAEARLVTLMQDWAQVRQALQRPDAEDPATTVELLDLIATLGSDHDAAMTSRHRLAEMRQEIAAFRAAVADLAARVSPELAGADAFDIVQALRQRLTEHRALARQHETLAAALQRADAALARQRKQRDDGRMALDGMLAVIGSDTIDAAQARVALAAERARMEAALRHAAQDLRGKGDGHTLAALREDVASIPADDIPGAIETAQAERDSASREAQGLSARVATLRVAMEQEAQADAATEAAAAGQAAAATLRRVTEEAALMHLAEALLKEALTQVDLAGSSALLARISTLFRTITGGAFRWLEVEEQGDGSAALIAVQDRHPEERKAVAQLSEGERDQLFLALRLAAIEDHVTTSPPLPFVCDDILQTFDDDRAAAAMHALLQLSDSVQVILLSHHRHLAGLAQRLPAECLHLCRLQAWDEENVA